MTNPKHYHVVLFDRVEEAAAFVAALSRFLSSPEGTSASIPRPIEVWAIVLANDGGAEVYLSDGAFAATVAGLAPPVTAGVRDAHEVTIAAARLITDGDPIAYTTGDIMIRLTNAGSLDQRA